MSGFENALALLPGEIRRASAVLERPLRDRGEEFRLRLGRKPSLTLPEGEYELPGCGPVDRSALERVLELATRASPYAAATAMGKGFVNAGNGIRVGLCGRFSQNIEGLPAVEALSSVSIRIPRQIRGCAGSFCWLPFASTLIVSPPGGGKTTFLRDMVRCISDRGVRVALCDERGEVAAMGEDGPLFDVGRCTDVISDLPKKTAAIQLLRTMNPKVLAMDEITATSDAAACREAARCGVRLLATVHAGTDEDGGSPRTMARDLGFSRLLWIKVVGGRREYREEFL